MAIEVCGDGTGFIVACEEKSSGNIKLLKINHSGTINTSFNYSSNLEHVLVPGGGQVSLGIKEITENRFILGGVFSNTNDWDMFTETVYSNGNRESLHIFVNPGKDCRC